MLAVDSALGKAFFCLCAFRHRPPDGPLLRSADAAANLCVVLSSSDYSTVLRAIRGEAMDWQSRSGANIYLYSGQFVR